ncbi:hypothetical protein [Streptomyces cucumeris]|uniref:hypothetical protein n=1 Tax=Streptomyces cucumeris TaxID=2962890 RepID=UPI0020C8FF0C|nr:hypothetical protein [Streptomyces sp. NEAU-Y11]MCP9212971.1 hypothetical protein [Streptomyces sp. NEAU-Y11]
MKACRRPLGVRPLPVITLHLDPGGQMLPDEGAHGPQEDAEQGENAAVAAALG